MTDAEIVATRAGQVLEIRLNRPERRNALTVDLVDQLHEQMREAEANEAIGAILICGAGNSLCSGLDLKDPRVREIGPRWQELHRAIALMQTPVLVALEGAAVNAGAALTFAGDLVIAGRSAFLEVMEARIGMMPPVNLAWLLHRHSVSLASRLAISCDRITGTALADLGIAHDVVDDDVVLERARERATQIAEYPKGSARGVRSMIHRGVSAQGSSFDRILDALVADQEDQFPAPTGQREGSVSVAR